MRINDLAREHATELDALIDGAIMLDSQGYGINCKKEMSAIFTIQSLLVIHSIPILFKVHGKRNYSNWNK